MADLQLQLQLGGLMIFGPRRGRAVLVRQVVPTIALLELQAKVAEICRAEARGQFAPGRWTPHVTLARRMPPDQLPEAIAVLDRTVDRPVTAGCGRAVAGTATARPPGCSERVRIGGPAPAGRHGRRPGAPGARSARSRPA